MSDATNIIPWGQPTGTLVERAIKSGKFKVTARELIPIEDLKVGDYVSSYHFTDSAIYARTILGTHSFNYNGNLIQVNIDGESFMCSPNQKCLVRYRDISRDYCVYIMRKGNSFRVGMSKMWHTDNGCGPYKRLVDEGGDELWILKTFNTRREALMEEGKISIKFRLPQTMFKFKEGRGSWSQEEFDYVWAEVSNREDAKIAIEHYNRDILYPYFNRSKKNVSIKRPHECYACNLLENSEMMIRDKKWMNVKLTVIHYEGTLNSITVSKNDNYYGNNILIHS